MNRIKRTLILLLVLGGQYHAQAQIGNEWIDYGKTYWKIKVGKNGIYRVPLSALTGISPTVNGSNFILYLDGVEQPISTTTNGVFGINDYLEFYGKKADGLLDKSLYIKPEFQPNDGISLFSDTAVYFLTTDAQSNHLRYTNIPNNIPNNPPTPQPFCIATVRTDFTRNFNSGRTVYTGQNIPLSLFDNAEGYIDSIVPVGAPINYTFNAPNAIAAPMNAVLRSAVLRGSYYVAPDNIKIFFNNQQIADSALPQDATKHFTIPFPASLVSNSNTLQFIALTGGTQFDQYGVSFWELKYPRDFNFNNTSFFQFSLPPNNSPTYLEFNNFSIGTNPRLYDLTNKKWYGGNVALSGKIRFLIDPSLSAADFVIYAEGSSDLTTISQTQSILFKNFITISNQGNYIILTHGAYDASVNGHNYVTDYKNYRSSTTGGSYNATIVDVRELYDQFAYGHDIHPLAISRFLKYAYDSFSVRPKYAFFIGKGLLYHKYRTYQNSSSLFPYAGIVPTYGDLGSDNDFVNFLPNRMQAMKVGRFNAWNGQEVGNYLEKIKAFEAALKPTGIPTHENDGWKKQVLHIGGGLTFGQQQYLLGTLNIAGDILKDTSLGAQITTISKSTTDPLSMVNNKSIDSLVNTGLSLIDFNGHATSNGFDFSIKDPESYTTVAKFPHFIALGCDVAQIFNLNSTIRTLSERYLIAPVGGSISVLASNNLQFQEFHRIYLPTVANSISRKNYGSTIGTHQMEAYDSLLSTDQSEGTYYQLESLLLQGDPALPFYGLPKPDFHVASNRLSSIPSNVTNTLDSFTLKLIAFNLAKAIDDTVRIKIEHTNPAGNTTTLKYLYISKLMYSDTIFTNLPVNKIADVGLNKYTVTIDDNNKFDEVSEANNVATLEIFIYSDNLIPVYPKEFSIVNTPTVTLKASTLNPFRPIGKYKIEIDTTQLFNSSLKQQTIIVSGGGVIKWTPSISFTDSTVYYWRTSYDSAVNGSYQWANSSFIYLANGTPGWNQSHYFQYMRNAFNGLLYDSTRVFRYPVSYNVVTASNAVYADQIPNWPWNKADFVKVMINGFDIQRLGCYPWGGTLQINVFDSLTNAPWKNDSINGTSGAYPVCLDTRDYFTFEFPVNTPQGRANAAHFLDSIPAGNFVLVRNIINLGMYDSSFVDKWKLDAGQNLYQKIINLGFSLIDSFTSIRPFMFFTKKGDVASVRQYIGKNIQDTIVRDFLLPTLRPHGDMNSVVIGPAKQWQQLKWSYSTDNKPQNDNPSVIIWGIDQNNQSTQLYNGHAQDTSLSFINATQYPNIKMVWHSLDSITLTSPQLRYWRVLYSPVPEAALNPNAYLVVSDSLQVGQPFNFGVAIENISDFPMDSMLVRYKLIDAGNNTHLLSNKRYRPLPANDTLHANFNFNPQIYTGNNIFFIEANPDNDQPEQYHPNNLGYLPFKVQADLRNPLIDVTFDGVHILDRDIVSSKPFIKIVMRDENKFLKLDDTGLIKLRIRYPSDVGTTRTIPFDNKIARFIPASPGSKNNEATIEYRPNLPEEGIYELFVYGKDKSGNEAGPSDYQVAFEVIQKSTITNVLNYPNPFSTSTAFLFTLTGSEIPTQFKIQILTVTGKVVREITRQEIGPIHIGRNITEYKWDGKDQYGQLLGNGVYLYRVVTSINGNDIEHRENMDGNSQRGTNNVDKFFKNGYGKMYIMR
ncbi:MAG: hypothetical protein JSS64_06740 [Bacteroidetes bacterium]|nr:hypothetical protein [Bacteroidota bacterium]